MTGIQFSAATHRPAVTRFRTVRPVEGDAA